MILAQSGDVHAPVGDKSTHVRNLRLDDEAPFRRKVLRDMPKARQLGLARRQQQDGVVDAVDQRVAIRQFEVRVVGDRDRHAMALRFRSQQGDHFLGGINPMDGNAFGQQGKRYPTRSNSKFKGRAFSGAHRQERYSRGRIQAAVPDVVIVDVGPVTAVRRHIRQEVRDSRLRGD